MIRSRRAFTSIELLVVLSVVSILTAVAVPGVMSSLRRNAMASSVNGIVGLTEQARGLAVSMSPPISSDPSWTQDDRFGIVLHQRDDGRYVATMTRGPLATEPARWAANRRGEAPEFVLPAGVMVYTAASVGDEPQPLSGELGWTLAYRTGATVVDGLSGASIGAPGSPRAERVLLRSLDGVLEAEFAVYPIGLAYGSEVRER